MKLKRVNQIILQNIFYNQLINLFEKYFSKLFVFDDNFNIAHVTFNYKHEYIS